MPWTTVLSLQDVTVRYGAAVAVDALCLDVRRGEIFGLLGPNGSGKSSTLSAVAGAVAPGAGVIRVRGRCERDDPLAYRRLIGLAPQELAFYEELSAEENLRFFGRIYGLAGRELRRRVAETLHFVRLTEPARRPARTYSGGMKRRLNLACALLHEPALLLLDEPTVGLDLPSRDAIFASLEALRQRGCAVVLATHHLQEAERLCDRVGVMDHGRLVACGPLRELFAGLADDDFTPALSALHEPPAGGRTPRLERLVLELTGRGGAAA